MLGILPRGGWDGYPALNKASRGTAWRAPFPPTPTPRMSPLGSLPEAHPLSFSVQGWSCKQLGHAAGR